MHDLYASVVRHLKIQRDSTADLKLWDDIWNAYERVGAEGVAKFINGAIELPDTDGEEQT